MSWVGQFPLPASSSEDLGAGFPENSVPTEESWAVGAVSGSGSFTKGHTLTLLIATQASSS